MKRLVVLVLTMVMLLSLCACESKKQAFEEIDSRLQGVWMGISNTESFMEIGIEMTFRNGSCEYQQHMIMFGEDTALGFKSGSYTFETSSREFESTGEKTYIAIEGLETPIVYTYKNGILSLSFAELYPLEKQG